MGRNGRPLPEPVVERTRDEHVSACASITGLTWE